MDEVELDVSASPELLPLLLCVGEGHVFPAVDDGNVGGQESGEAVLDKGEELLLVLLRLVEVVEEDTTDAACFAAVLVAEVLVAPLFEPRVVALVVLVAGLLDCLMEVDRILVVHVRGCEVTAAAVPPCVCIAKFVGRLEVAVVEVNGWGVGVVRVQDHGQASGKKLDRIYAWIQGFVIYAHFLYCGAREAAIDDRGVDACLLKDLAILQHASYATPAFWPLP